MVARQIGIASKRRIDSAACGASAPRHSARAISRSRRGHGRGAAPRGRGAPAPRGGARACRRRRGSSGRSAPARIPRARALARVCSMSAAVDGQRAGLVEARRRARARRSRRGAPTKPPADEDRRRVIGGLAARARAGPAVAPMRLGHRRRAGRPAGRRPRPRPSRRAARRWPARCRRTRPAGGTRRPGCRRPRPARGPPRPRAPEVWTRAWPPYSRSSPASRGMASSGTARMMSSASSRSARRLGEGARARARASGSARAAPRRGTRPRRPASRPGEGHAERRPHRARRR